MLNAIKHCATIVGYESFAFIHTGDVNIIHDSSVTVDTEDATVMYYIYVYESKLCYLFKVRLNLVVKETVYENDLTGHREGRYVTGKRMLSIIMGNKRMVEKVFE